MLRELHVNNFILVESGTISFAEGLNIISGASGAGKTILVKALKLLLGERASAEMIGPHAKKATVEGFFRYAPEFLREKLEDAAPLAMDENGELVATRLLEGAGENRCYLNGRPVTLQIFRRVMIPLMEIATQEGQSLLARPDERAAILDRYAGTGELRRDFTRALQEARDFQAELARMRENAAERRDRIDLLTFQIGEIQKLGLEPGETDRLEEEHRLLRHATEVMEVLASGRRDLYEEDGSVTNRLGAVLRTLESLAIASEPRIAACIENLHQTLAAVEETAFAMRDLQEDLDADPERLDSVEERLSEIHRTLTRYGPTEADFFGFLQRLTDEHARINLTDQDLARLENELEAREARLARLGRELHRKRRSAATRLTKEITSNLGRLLMSTVTFSIEQEVPDWNRLISNATAHGPSPIRFLVATHPGAKPAPVERVASGGERSRVLLALLSALGRCTGTPSMIFDEIDENVGSRLGPVVGGLLRSLSRDLQVITITHLPTIAALGDVHHKVEKTISKTGASVLVKELKGRSRTEEIAEMLSGPSPPEGAFKEAMRILKDHERSTGE